MGEVEFRKARDEALERHGIEAKERMVNAPSVDGRACVLVAGDGPPVVLLNGIGTPAAMWAPLMGHLEGFTLYAVDLPGYGLTDTNADIVSDLRATAVQFLVEVLDGLRLETPHVIGNSLGSSWSFWLALAHPGRIRSMVHVGCPALVPGMSAPPPMRLLSVPWLGPLMMRLEPPSRAQVERLAKMVHEHPLSPEIADLLLETERMPGFEATFLGTLRTLLRLRGVRPEMVLDETRLGRVPHPSLLLFGSRDPMGAGRVGERLERALPNARLHIVDAGHAPYLRHSGELAPLITTFLNEAETTAATQMSSVSTPGGLVEGQPPS